MSDLSDAIGSLVTAGRVSGRVAKIVRKGDNYVSDILRDHYVKPRTVSYSGESFAVVVDSQDRSHHVSLSEI